jgi:hypothetical protein
VNAATTRRLGDQIAALQGPALWTIAGFVLYVLGWVGAMLLLYFVERTFLEPLGIRPEAGMLSLSVRNGVHALAWGVLVAAVAAPLGRRLVEGIRFSATGWAMLAAGLVVAGVITMLGNEFVRERIGYYDPDAQGLSFFAGPAVVAVALATWAALAMPRSGVVVPGAAMLTAAAGLAMSLLPSLSGVTDGIDATSLPLAVSFLVAVAYAGVAAVLVLLRLGRSGG